MKNLNIMLNTVAILALVCVTTPGIADGRVAFSQPTGIKILLNRGTAFVHWLNEPWAGNDAPYAALRDQIEQSQRTGDLASLLTHFATEYQSHPDSLTVQFKYFLALCLNRWQDNVEHTYIQELQLNSFTDRLMNLNYPPTYNYKRLAAICYGCRDTEPKLMPFLRRLIRQDPSDIEAQYALPSMLAVSNDAVANSEAVVLADSLVSKYPDCAAMYTMQGGVCFRMWKESGNAMYARKAITAYQKYLRVTPQNADFRDVAEQYIRIIQKG